MVAGPELVRELATIGTALAHSPDALRGLAWLGAVGAWGIIAGPWLPRCLRTYVLAVGLLASLAFASGLFLAVWSVTSGRL